MMIQNTITTVVEPIVSWLVGNETFLNSLLTSFINSTIEAHVRFSMKILNPSVKKIQLRRFSAGVNSERPIKIRPLQQAELAGALGFEPRLSVLETDVLPLTPCP